MNDQPDEVGPLDQKIDSALGPVVRSAAPEPGKAFWHYTDSKAFEGILQHKEIWATDYRFLNDAQEMLVGEEDIYAVVEELRAPRGGGQFTGLLRGLWDRYAAFRVWAAPSAKLLSVAVASFSEKEDDLSQWRAYGAGPRGCGLSIGITFLDCDAWSESVGAILVPCDYDREHFRQEVKNAFVEIDRLHAQLLAERVFKPDEIRTALLSRAHQKGAVLAARRKHPGFAGEQEWRIVTIEADTTRIHRRDGRGGVQIPYVKLQLPLAEGLLSLEGVRVGPSPDLIQRVADVRLRLAGSGYDLAKVSAVGSEIPYRPPLGD